ncbi:hypothetical protein D3C87_1807430 [compost metagenome]
MIWVDNLQVYGSPDYFVQKLFSLNKGTEVISITRNEQAVSGQDSLYASSVIDAQKKELIIKVVNYTNSSKNADFILNSKLKLQTKVTIEEMAGAALSQINSFKQPALISPKMNNGTLKNKQLSVTLKPYSFNVIKIPFR